MMWRYWQLLGIAGAFISTAALAQATPLRLDDRVKVAGWVETLTFPDYGISLDALLDTGADFSSLHVSALYRFSQNGQIWYRFNLTGRSGKIVTLEQQSDRILRIHRAEVPSTRRPIVRMKVCVAGQIAEADFSLTDRTGQNHAALIGRNFLARRRILVDPTRTHLFSENCGSAK